MLEPNPQEDDKQPESPPQAETPPAPEQPAPPSPPNLDISKEKVSQDIKEERATQDIGEQPSHPVKVFSILVLLLVILGTGLIFGIILWRRSQTESLNAAIAKGRQKLETPELKETEEILITLKKQINILGDFKQSQQLTSKLFQKIQSTVHQRIKYSSVSLSPEGNLDFSGEAENYQTLAKLLVSLKQDHLFEQITLTSSSLVQNEEKTRVSFAISAKIQPNLLLKTEPASGTGQENTESQTEGEPSGQ